MLFLVCCMYINKKKNWNLPIKSSTVAAARPLRRGINFIRFPFFYLLFVNIYLIYLHAVFWYILYKYMSCFYIVIIKL